ncbi:MAG TPA: PadR family transcriptional regulator [Gemmatimonadaceae bacterium]|nr:PadR family transcriptional regulator [Gemmatimonadaceae bacterium]
MPRSERSPSELIPGTLEMLILQALRTGPMHGYAIGQHITKLSQDVLQVEQGSLYPAFERLLDAGYVTAKWQQTPQNRRARYYTITASGRKRLGENIANFDRALLAINRVMNRA